MDFKFKIIPNSVLNNMKKFNLNQLLLMYNFNSFYSNILRIFFLHIFNDLLLK